MILVTGANGMTGRAVLAALQRRGARTRALTTGAAGSPAADALRAAGASDVVTGRFDNPPSLLAACSGIDTVFHIPPRMKPEETQNGLAVIAAAKAAAVKRIALHSVINSQIQAIRFHVNKRLVEEAAMTSGLPWVIFQSTNYMQNVAWNWQRIVDNGEFVFPYSADVLVSWVDLGDYADAVATALVEPGYDWGVFEIAGNRQPLNRHEMAAIFSHATGREIRAVTMPLDDYMALPHWQGRDPREMALLRTMFEEFDRHGAPGGNWRVLSMLIGRMPVQYDEFAHRYAKARGLAPTSPETTR